MFQHGALKWSAEQRSFHRFTVWWHLHTCLKRLLSHTGPQQTVEKKNKLKTLQTHACCVLIWRCREPQLFQFQHGSQQILNDILGSGEGKKKNETKVSGSNSEDGSPPKSQCLSLTRHNPWLTQDKTYDKSFTSLNTSLFSLSVSLRSRYITWQRNNAWNSISQRSTEHKSKSFN